MLTHAEPDPDPQHWFIALPEIDLEQVGTGLRSSLYSLLIFLVNFLAPESGSAFQIQTYMDPDTGESNQCVSMRLLIRIRNTGFT